jgi:hypothetical protein
MSDPIRRIEEAIAELGAEYEPPAGWEARVLAATGVRKRRWWWLAGPAVAAAAAAAVAVAVWPRPHDLRLAVDVEAGGGPVRGSSARVGDVLHVRVTDGAGHRALWVYRDDALVVACPGAPGCRSTGDALGVDLALDSIGKYVVVALSSSAALPVPAGAYDDDVASALRAGATKQDQAVTVH